MGLASLIISVIALLLSIASLVWLLAKQMSSHTIQYIDPFKTTGQDEKVELGKDLRKDFKEIGDPLDEDELNYLEEVKKKRMKRNKLNG